MLRILELLRTTNWVNEDSALLPWRYYLWLCISCLLHEEFKFILCLFYYTQHKQMQNSQILKHTELYSSTLYPQEIDSKFPPCSKNNKVYSYSKGPTGDTALMKGDTWCTVCKSVLLLNRSLKAKNKQASSTNKVMRKFLLHCRGWASNHPKVES